MNPSIRRRIPWALAALVGVATLGSFMRNPGSFFLGVLGGMALAIVVGALSGAFRGSPTE